MYVCAGNIEQFSFAFSIGVGLCESIITLTQLCEKKKPESLIFIGTAGSYSEEIKLLDLYTSTSAMQIEIGFLEQKSYTPLNYEINSIKNVSCETIQKIKNKNLPEAMVNSSNFITRDSHHASLLLQQKILLENMEFFGIMSVAKRFRIPCLGVFCISNYCNSSAREDFLKNHHLAIEKLEEFVRGIK